MAIKAAVINFKGGVGKTTLAFHLSAHLARTHRVLMIDVDHQSSLSAIVLSARLWEQCQQNGMTTNRIFEAYCNRRVMAPGAEIILVSGEKWHVFARLLLLTQNVNEPACDVSHERQMSIVRNVTNGGDR